MSWITQLWLVENERRTLEIPALEAWSPRGSILLAEIPGGAEVLLSGTKVFPSTKRPLHVQPGTYRIEVRQSGFRPWIRTVAVAEGEKVSLRVGALAPAVRRARLLLSGEPQGAKIYLNGRYVGDLPRRLSDLNPGSHILKVVHDGFQEWLQEVTLKEGQEASLAVVLDPLQTYGRIRVRGTSGAQVYLDGQYVGTIPQTVDRVATGTRVLRAVLEGHHEHQESIVVEADITLDLDISLKNKRGRSFLDRLRSF